MSLRQFLTRVSGAVFVSGVLVLATPVSGADYTAAGTGSVEITFAVPATPDPPQPEPEPNPQPEQPFDWNWTYPAPTCNGITIVFPSNLPASQQGVVEVNVVGGSVSGMQYKLEGQQYQMQYPNGHAGQTVFIAWSELRNYSIPATGTWTVTQLQVRGTNYHWTGSLVCGSTPTPQPVPNSVPASEPTVASEPPPTPTSVPESEPVPAPASEEVVQSPVEATAPPFEEPTAPLPNELYDQEGVTEE